MARPKTEQGPTPAKLRQAKSLQDLRTAGGDKIAAKLPPESFAKLKRCQAALGATATITETVIAAIDVLDAKLARAASRGGMVTMTGSFGLPMSVPAADVGLAIAQGGKLVARRRRKV